MEILPEVKNSAGKRQHIVPKFILKNFSGNDGFVSILMKKERKLIKARPDNVMLRKGVNDFNTFSGETLTIEYAISRLESDIAPSIQGILNRGALTMEDSERTAIAHLISLQIMRGQLFRTALGAMALESINEQMDFWGVPSISGHLNDKHYEGFFRWVACSEFGKIYPFTHPI